MTDTPTAPRRRKSWIIAVPFSLLVVLAIGWCGLWFYASDRAQREIDAWIVREKTLGRIWNCGERTFGGFPFRFELLCKAPTLDTQGGDPLRISAANAHVVAQIWAPNHIVAEFAAPAKVEDPRSGRIYEANWSLLQMSGIGDTSGRPQRFALVVDQPDVKWIPAPGTDPLPVLSAKHVEIHARRNPATTAVPDGVDYAASIEGGESAALAAAGATGPLNLNLQGTVTAAEDFRPMAVADRLRAWAAAGGIFKLDTLTVTTPKAAISASGALALDPAGRLNGAVNVGFAGIEEVTKNLARTGLIPPNLAPIVGALALAGKPGDVAGRRGATFSLLLKEGVLQLGKFPVGIIPPLY
ncbi:DUF2125 domain-containing protein [Xanthobacter sp. DSM 24535]|uniref:DUF2125 domain-containing protein n=1 Tax=Roseixanthobacter psychrophilus TaxID=3119917 RepID=UPI00372C413F